jgi:hypothetical protein
MADDVVSTQQEVSDVFLSNQVVARVFEGRPGHFYWVNWLTDEAPKGPFRSRESAELDADIELDLDRKQALALLMLDT